MDIKDFPLHFEYTLHGGFSVGIEEQTVLTWSLRELQNLNSFDKTYFWGIIFGETNNYYIAFGIHKDFIKGITYFYSLNCEEWVLLPKPEEKLFHLVSIMPTLFTGDPSYQISVLDEELGLEGMEHLKEEAFQPESSLAPEKLTLRDALISRPESFEEENVKISAAEESKEESLTNVLKEEDRLSITVHMITEECAIVPRGGLIKQLHGQIILDEYFRGLNEDESLEFRSYFHYRVPRQKWNENLQHRTDSDFSVDILDTIDDDIPQRKTWTIRKTTDDMIVIMNLTWPGMMFYHNLYSNIFGFVYFGNGRKNVDLPFML